MISLRSLLGAKYDVITMNHRFPINDVTSFSMQETQ